jgi:hypothetical protein
VATTSEEENKNCCVGRPIIVLLTLRMFFRRDGGGGEHTFWSRDDCLNSALRKSVDSSHWSIPRQSISPNLTALNFILWDLTTATFYMTKVQTRVEHFRRIKNVHAYTTKERQERAVNSCLNLQRYALDTVANILSR